MKRNLPDSRAIVTGASSGIGREWPWNWPGTAPAWWSSPAAKTGSANWPSRSPPWGGRSSRSSATSPIRRPGSGPSTPPRAKLGGLDILVNNAGVGAMGLFEDAEPERVRRVMEVNFFALVEMTRLALPLLKQGVKPIVVNVSSILGHRGVPYSSEYCASKFAVQGFSESIRAEFARQGIDVLVVSPGTTETEFFDSVIERTARAQLAEAQPVIAAEVARQTVRAIRRGRHEIIPIAGASPLLAQSPLAATGGPAAWPGTREGGLHSVPAVGRRRERMDLRFLLYEEGPCLVVCKPPGIADAGPARHRQPGSPHQGVPEAARGSRRRRVPGRAAPARSAGLGGDRLRHAHAAQRGGWPGSSRPRR